MNFNIYEARYREQPLAGFIEQWPIALVARHTLCLYQSTGHRTDGVWGGVREDQTRELAC